MIYTFMKSPVKVLKTKEVNNVEMPSVTYITGSYLVQMIEKFVISIDRLFPGETLAFSASLDLLPSGLVIHVDIQNGIERIDHICDLFIIGIPIKTKSGLHMAYRIL